jgi:hypothetical protein
MDGVAYAFGKGATATTITAPLTSIPQGQSIMITGTVTDQSPAQPGTPAIADEAMDRWMEYLHMQKTMPTDAKGVQVKLTAVDNNGHTYDIGVTTSDIAGSYGIKWTPPEEGTYQIKATFEGTNSYSSSYATTYIAVDEAPETSPNITSTPTPTASTTETPTQSPTASPSPIIDNPSGTSNETLLIAAAAAVITIIVIGAAVVLLRKKQ